MTGTQRGPAGGRRWPWRPGSATGIGSLPGTDIVEAVRIIVGELPDLPHLPELPGRGPGADVIGRGAALLSGLPVELYAGQWRATGRAGRDLRHSRELLEQDLDALAESGAGLTGPVKVQAAGPWTLAASLERPRGGRMLADRGAVRDLTASLAEGLRAHVTDVRRRLPAADPVVQLDEPSLPAVLAGRIPTESGLWAVPAVEPGIVLAALGSITASVGAPVVLHCCASGVPFGLLRQVGVTGVSIDLDLIDDDLDAVAEVVDAGVALFAGAVPALATAGAAPSAEEIARRIGTFWRRLGFPADRLADQVVVTASCGLAGADPGHARAVLRACVEAGSRLID